MAKKQITPNGLTMHGINEFCEIVIKANDEQLEILKQEIIKEQVKRSTKK